MSDDEELDFETFGPGRVYANADVHASARVESGRSRRRAAREATREARRDKRKSKESKRGDKDEKRSPKSRQKKAEKNDAVVIRARQVDSSSSPKLTKQVTLTKVTKTSSSSTTSSPSVKVKVVRHESESSATSNQEKRVVFASPPRSNRNMSDDGARLLLPPDASSVGSRSVVRFDETSERSSQSSEERLEWKFALKRKESRRRRSTIQTEATAPDFNSLFAELREGGDGLTKNLKHLSRDEKERRLAASRSTPANKSFVRTKTLAPIDFAPLVEPVSDRKVELIHGREWRVENVHQEKDIVEIHPNKIMETVLIRNCEECTIRVNKKVNSIIVENCRVVNVIADSLIASFEIIRCQKLQVQVMNSCLCYTLDGVDGCTIFLSEMGREAQIVASKISEVNVSFPSKQDPEDFVKVPIPEQFVYTVNDQDKVDSRVSDLYG